jgi:hypothetical protein
MTRIASAIGWLVISVTLSTPTHAQISPDKRAALVGTALNGFWGRAVDSKGQPLEPASESERTTSPVPQEWVELSFDVGEVSGRLESCSLNWIDTFRALTSRARREGFSDKQVAFVAVLHGVAQDTILDQRRANQCNESDKAVALRQEETILERLKHDAA